MVQIEAIERRRCGPDLVELELDEVAALVPQLTQRRHRLRGQRELHPVHLVRRKARRKVSKKVRTQVRTQVRRKVRRKV